MRTVTLYRFQSHVYVFDKSGNNRSNPAIIAATRGYVDVLDWLYAHDLLETIRWTQGVYSVINISCNIVYVSISRQTADESTRSGD